MTQAWEQRVIMKMAYYTNNSYGVQQVEHETVAACQLTIFKVTNYQRYSKQKKRTSLLLF